MKTRILLAGIAALGTAAFAEETNLIVEVHGERPTASSRPGSQLLEDVPSLALRQQGTGGAQADLSIRGSSFNTTGLLLNGAALRNSQTEHWHADLPAPEVWFEPPRVRTGLDRFRLSSGHPSGSVDLRLAPLWENLHSVTLGGGDKELFFANAVLTETTELEHGGTAGASAFASFDHDSQTDGYADNDLLRFTGGARIGAYGERLEGDLIATGGWREFGARGFYGTVSSYPAEEEVTDYLVSGNLRWVEDPDNPAQLTATWQRLHDLYWLDKHRHAFYENEHTSDTLSLHGNDRHSFGEYFSLDTRADTELETIDSSALGDHTREHLSLAALPNLTLDGWTFTLGGSWELFSAYSPQFAPAGGVTWEFTKGQTVGVNYTESFRQPSYTELNYESQDILGDNSLGVQQSRTVELVWKGECGNKRWDVTGFYERGRDIVDWIRDAPGARWTAVNQEPIDAWGITANGAYRTSSGTELGADGMLLKKLCDTDCYSSRYALDYANLEAGIHLRQDLNKAFSWIDDRLDLGKTRYNKGLFLKLREGAAHYAPNPVRRHGSTELTSNAELQWLVKSGLALNVGIVNLLDNDFQTYPGQNTCGRRWYLSVTYTW